LEQSYRDGKKVRKRTLAYYGRQKPGDTQARMEQMLSTAERKAEAIDARQRRDFGETGAERQERTAEEAKFSQEAFLQESVVQAGSAVGAELDEGQADKHQEGEGGEADSGGDGDVAIGEGHDD
jgi:hypothetical protein